MANAGYLKSVTGVLKIVEILFVLTSLIIMREKRLALFGNHFADTSYLGIGIMVACIIVTPLLLICYLTGKMEIQQSIFEVCVNVIFGVCLVVFGSLAMDSYANLPKIYTDTELRDYGISMSFFSLASGVAYLADAALAYQKLRHG